MNTLEFKFCSFHEKIIIGFHITLNLIAEDCNPPCVNGMCSTQGQCACSAGWTGSTCAVGKHS